MLKSNTGKEVFYIFVWLVGIIFFYTLVFIFILEPSNEKNKSTETKHVSKNDITNKNNIVSSDKKEMIKSVKSIKSIDKIEKSVERVEDVVVTKKSIEISNVKSPIVSTPTIPKVVTIPKSTLSKPTVPSVPSLPSIQKIKTKKIEKIEASQLTLSSPNITEVTDKIEKVLSHDEEIKRLETTREQVRQEAEALRKEVIKILER